MESSKTEEKPKHPRASANCISALTFWWTLKTFKRGWKHEMQETDIFEPLHEHKSDYLGDKIEKYWNQEIQRAQRKKRNPSLHRVIVKCFGAKIMFYGLILFIMEVCLRVSQPLFLGRLLQFFGGPKVNSCTQEEAYVYAGGVVLCSALNIFVIHPYMMAIFHIGMKMRVACCSLIYRKALRLSMAALGETTAGQVVNLIANDVNRFDVGVVFLHYLWIGPLETMVVTYFMWQEVGISAVIGVASLLLFIPLQGYLGNRTSVYRMRTAVRTDARVRLMNEIISGIQVIKMYTWELPFAQLVNISRRNEIKAIRCSSYIRGISLSFIMFSTRISVFISILAYVMFGNHITAVKVFVLVSYYQILRQTMTVFFPQGITQVAEADVSIKRIQNFLLCEERDARKQNGGSMKKQEQVNDGLNHNEIELSDVRGVKLTDVTAKWLPQLHENSLNKVTLDIKPGTLVAVIGPVGAGKTSLLHVILKELPLTEGKLRVGGSVSYASQEPWLFAGSVRQNILFGQPFVRERYSEVVRVCSLKRDFKLFPYGDKTIVGERGVSLSGGQRARVNLARAIYKIADVYLLDDPLSAVDPHVSKHLFDDCIVGFLKGKTVILATHQLHHLKFVDQIVILSNGSVAAHGTYDQLHATGLDFAKLLEEDVDETEDTIDEIPLQKMLRQMSISSMTSVDEKKQPEPKQVAEMRSEGSVSSKVYAAYLRAGGNCCAIFMMIMLFIIAQAFASGSDYWLTYWTNLEEERWDVNHQLSAVYEQSNSVNASLEEFSALSSDNSSDTEHTTVSQDIFTTEFSDFSNDSLTTVNSTSRSLRANAISNSYWLSSDFCIYVYTAITAGTIVVTLIRSLTFFTVCMRASINLHDSMFRSISMATMYFFNTNPSGRILNRFSKDMGAIDELLPAAMIDVLQIGLTLIGIIIVVAVVNYWLLLPTFFVGVTFYIFRIFYLHTSRSVKRLEGMTRSPVFQHLNASLQGLTTIRAFHAEEILEKEFDNHQDLHSGAWYLFIATSRAFGFWLDVVCLIYIAIVTFSFLFIGGGGGDTTGGNVGLAITQAIGLTGMLQWGMRQSTELENQMTSVERVVEFTQVEQEPSLESTPDKKPPKSWPSEGAIMFDHLYLRYSKGEAPVLKDLSFSIAAREKVGIVGRTGAGKSSLISALFRLSDLEGSIYIDGIDTSTIGLHDLRRKLSIIPQEPVLFSGTLRKNLDPFDEYSDSTLWEALAEVELKAVVDDLPGGLTTKVMEGGSNFSVGQRQLVCLARAIVRNNTILVLDEATANVDPRTDTLIQMTIREKFAKCTVLTIAHRLNTVMDSDKVLVMDAGIMVEFDHPHLLLKNHKTFLYNMVQQTGKKMAESLIKKAKDHFELSRRTKR